MDSPPVQLRDALEIEAIAEDHLGDQVIRGMRHANTQAEIHFPFRRKIQIDGRENLVLLLTCRKKIRRLTNSAIVFKSAGDFFREVVAELEVGRKRDSLRDAGTMERAIKGWIKRPIPWTRLLINNRADLPGPG